MKYPCLLVLAAVALCGPVLAGGDAVLQNDSGLDMRWSWREFDGSGNIVDGSNNSGYVLTPDDTPVTVKENVTDGHTIMMYPGGVNSGGWIEVQNISGWSDMPWTPGGVWTKTTDNPGIGMVGGQKLRWWGVKTGEWMDNWRVGDSDPPTWEVADLAVPDDITVHVGNQSVAAVEARPVAEDSTVLGDWATVASGEGVSWQFAPSWRVEIRQGGTVYESRLFAVSGTVTVTDTSGGGLALETENSAGDGWTDEQIAEMLALLEDIQGDLDSSGAGSAPEVEELGDQTPEYDTPDPSGNADLTEEGAYRDLGDAEDWDPADAVQVCEVYGVQPPVWELFPDGEDIPRMVVDWSTPVLVDVVNVTRAASRIVIMGMVCYAVGRMIYTTA